MARGAEQYLVDVHIFRLADCEGHNICESLCRHAEHIRVLANPVGDIRLRDAVGEFCPHGTGRDHCGSDIVGLDLLSQPL
jgi:hypothetical protein